ncbi:MAG: 4Fe-4S dicluster domain-containing protein [Peptostreptococcaceae bacterium]|nr:4Fe-4S dicluster domain-containing protein [Peptostreptococcaceae bacterium]
MGNALKEDCNSNNPQEAKEDLVAFIRCSGDAAGKKRFAGLKSCDEAKELGFIDGECQYGCLGLGTCIEKCDRDAMKLVDGKVIIDKEKCDGCGDCLDACVQKIISLVPRGATVFIPCSNEDEEEDKVRAICGFGCIGCGECEDTCPENAVKVIDNCAVIDYSLCVGCVACSVVCTKKIIIDEIHDLTEVKDHVAFVKCSGGSKAHAKFEELGIKSCKEASDKRYEFPELCQVGCVGCGDCVEVCRFDAIKVVDGTAVIDPDKCVGCFDCVHECPNNLIIEVPYVGAKQVACSNTFDATFKKSVCDFGCAGCGDCVNNCPNGAITLEGSLAIINPDLCENCGICSYVCTRGVIREQSVPEYNYLQKAALEL